MVARLDIGEAFVWTIVLQTAYARDALLTMARVPMAVLMIIMASSVIVQKIAFVESLVSALNVRRALKMFTEIVHVL